MKPLPSIAGVVAKRLCLYCGNCLAACPSDCIELTSDRRSDPLLVVGQGCTACGACLEVCPGRLNDWRPPPSRAAGPGEPPRVVIAQALPPLSPGRPVASGGAVSALARAFFDEHPDGLVQWTALVSGQGLLPQARWLDQEAFEKADGDSIYIPSFANRVFKSIPPQKPLIAIGLPCQVFGLQLLQKRLPGLGKQVRSTISLFCGLTIRTSGLNFLIKRQGGEPAAVTRMRFRAPFVATRTLWRLGSQTRWEMLWAWLIWFPKRGPLPQISQTRAISSPSVASGSRKL